MKREKYILAIDSGGSGIRALLFDKKGQIVERVREKTPWISPEEGAQEHNPEELWQSLLKVTRKVMKKGKLLSSDIAAIGISNQRASFMLWDKKTGEPITNLISWADVRAADTCDKMNHNFRWRLLKFFAAIVAKLTKNPMMLATRMLRFTTDHASTRLKWYLDTHPNVYTRCKNGEVQFGTLDSWFIYKLSGKTRHLSDISNAAASSLFNPFQLKWNSIVCNLFDIPMNIFPEVVDNNGDFGSTESSLFDGEIPIRCTIGDQMGALFGHCCFSKGDVKISQGSGSFVDLNVGNKPKTSKRGLFPLIGWSINGSVSYMLEGYVATAGTLIDWLGGGIGLSGSGPELDQFAEKCETTKGVIVIPTASGIRYPWFNPRTRASILGLSLSTHRRHVARAVLEGIAFRLIDIIHGMEKDTHTEIHSIKVDGGVSNSNILLQSLANFSDITVQRAPEADMSGTGAAYMAGLAVGFWKDMEELKSLQLGYSSFKPELSPEIRNKKLKKWNRAVHAIIKIDKIPFIGRKEFQD